MHYNGMQTNEKTVKNGLLVVEINDHSDIIVTTI
jgi:hypothetical protein